MPGQVGKDEKFHAVLLYLAIWRSVAAGDSGIDRYLSGTSASRREINQVNRRLATLALDMLDGIWCHLDLHSITPLAGRPQQVR